MQFALNNGVVAPTLFAGMARDDLAFDVVLSAAATTALFSGRYNFAYVYTSAGSAPLDVYVGDQGELDVLPGILATATPTQAQTMITGILATLETLNSNPSTSVNFNGQSYTFSSRSDLQAQLVFWQARAIAEERRLEELRGNRRNDGRIHFEFERPRNGFPWPFGESWRSG